MSNGNALGGKVALVTGAGGAGIGRAICERLAAHGAAIAMFDLSQAGLEATASELARSGTKMHFAAIDIAETARLDDAVDRATMALGDIDILINCAAMGGNARTIIDTVDEEWDKVFAVNVRRRSA